MKQFLLSFLFLFSILAGAQSTSLVDLETCADANGFGCFDLNTNLQAALGNNTPNTHQVTFHVTQADAANVTNPLPVTYCTSNSSEIIFTVVTEIATNTSSVVGLFNLITSLTPPIHNFSPVTACLTAGTNFLDFNATSVINETTNALAGSGISSFRNVYYSTLQDAQNETNSIGQLNTFTASINTSVIYVRTTYFNSGCFNIEPLAISTTTNCIFAGAAQDLEQCIGSGTTACFDLTVNDLSILGNNNPADFSVTYFTTNADAVGNVNQLATPTNYCTTVGQSIYARLEEISTGNSVVVQFLITIVNATIDRTTLTQITACDDNLDGNVNFDLTGFAQQLNSTHAFEYYLSLTDAQQQVNALTNPASTNFPVSGNQTIVFLREVIAGSCDTIYTAPIRKLSSCSNSYDCSNAQSLCSRLGQAFPNIYDGSFAQQGNYYPFSSSSGPRNPSWFYFQAETSGVINLEIYQNALPTFQGQPLDIDYVLYGPFTSPTAQCGMLGPNDVIDESFALNMPELATIPNAQAGEYYLLLTSNFTNLPGFIRVEIAGSSTGAVNCDGIQMNAFLDANLNGTVDSTDPRFPLGTFNYEKNMSGNVMQVATPLGQYGIYDVDPTNSYDLGYDVLSSYAANYTVSPASFTGQTIPIGSGLVNRDFLVTPITAYDDLIIYVIEDRQPRPGFTYTETVYYANLGTTPVPVGSVQVDYDATLSVISTSASTATVSPTTVDLTFSNLNPFELRSFDITYQVPTIPTVTLGDIVTNVATVNPVSNDLTPNNNVSTSSQVIIGSYDPNDKMESRGPIINPNVFTNNDYFYYTVRFQNTGTASAINVRIEDTLDAQLDWSTLEMINASHTYVMQRMDDQLVWSFDNIMLPDSTTDEPGSNGFVYFRIKPTTGWTEGTVIPNTAEIYFDFNPPIITNTFTTTFAVPLSIDTPDAVIFSMAPNPVKDVVAISLNAPLDNATITLYDVRGRVTLSRKLNPNNLQLELGDLTPGLYIAELRNGDAVYTTKIVKE